MPRKYSVEFKEQAAHQHEMATQRRIAKQWKKSLGRLRRENRELKRANGILKTASVFRSGTRPTLRPNDLLYRRV